MVQGAYPNAFRVAATDPMKAILDGAEQIEIFSLHPRPQDGGTFHGSKVLGKTSVQYAPGMSVRSFAGPILLMAGLLLAAIWWVPVPRKS